MTATTFHPGDIVKFIKANGSTTYEVDAHHFEGLAALGVIPVKSRRSGQERRVASDRLALVERGEKGKAADAEAQRQAEEIAKRDAAARRAAAQSCQRRSGTKPARHRLGAGRPAFAEQVVTLPPPAQLQAEHEDLMRRTGLEGYEGGAPLAISDPWSVAPEFGIVARAWSVMPECASAMPKDYDPPAPVDPFGATLTKVLVIAQTNPQNPPPIEDGSGALPWAV